MNFATAFHVGSVRGIEIRLHWSWALILVVLVSSLAEGVFGAGGGWSPAERWSAAVVTAVLFFGSLLLHELSHSLTAQHFGMRVSSITLHIFGGVSSLEGEMRSPGQEFRIAFVGPLTSLLLGAAFGAAWLATRSIGASAIFGYLGAINVMLAVFNLLPGFPLDGGRVFRSIVWARSRDLHRATRIAARMGAVIGGLLIAIGVLASFAFGTFAGIWYMLVGFFLLTSSRAAFASFLVDEVLEGAVVGDAMTAALSVDAETTLRELADRYLGRGGPRAAVVRRNGRAVGLISASDVAARPRSTWETVRADEVMTHGAAVVTTSRASDLKDAVRLMRERHVHQLAVRDEAGDITGMLAIPDVERFIEMRSELAPRRGDHNETPRVAPRT